MLAKSPSLLKHLVVQGLDVLKHLETCCCPTLYGASFGHPMRKPNSARAFRDSTAWNLRARLVPSVFGF